MRGALNVRYKATNNAALPVPARACTASEITFGGKCLNCGGVNGHAPQPNSRVNEYLRDCAARGFGPNPSTVEFLRNK